MLNINQKVLLPLFLVSFQINTMHYVTKFTNACDEKNEEKAKEIFGEISLDTEKRKTLELLFFKAGQLVKFNEKTKLVNILEEIKQNLKLEEGKEEYKRSKLSLEQIKKSIEEEQRELSEQRNKRKNSEVLEKNILDGVGAVFNLTGCTPVDIALDVFLLIPTYLVTAPIAIPNSAKGAYHNSKANKIRQKLNELEKSKAEKFEDTRILKLKVLQQKKRYARFLRGLIITLMQNKNISCHKCKTVKEPKELVLSCDKATCSKLLCKECKPTFDTNTCTQCSKKTDPRDHLLDLHIKAKANR